MAYRINASWHAWGKRRMDVGKGRLEKGKMVGGIERGDVCLAFGRECNGRVDFVMGCQSIVQLADMVMTAYVDLIMLMIV